MRMRMSAIEITCTWCGATVLVLQNDLGHHIDCPNCNKNFEAPRMAKRSQEVGNASTKESEAEEFDHWVASLRDKYGGNENQSGFTLKGRVKDLSMYLGGDKAVESSTRLLEEYILETDGEVPGDRDQLESNLTLKDDPDFYAIDSVGESMPRKPSGRVLLLWRGREVVEVEFECEYVDHPDRHLQTYDRTDPSDESAWLPIGDPQAYSEESYSPDLWYPDQRVRKNGKASLITEAKSGRPVEGLEDVLRRQKARGPKKDKWADFEEPTKGRKMTCWRCDYQGKTDKSRWLMGGFREDTCPRCGAKGTRPLGLVTRVVWGLGALVLLLMSLFALVGAVQNLRHDSTGAMTLGGLVGAAIPIILFFVCINWLAKDRAIRKAKKR